METETRSGGDASRRPAGRAATASLAGGIGGCLFIAGAVIASIAVLLPHPEEVDTTGYLLLAAAEFAFGLLLLVWGRRGGSAQNWIAPLTIAGAIVVVTASIYLDGERAGGQSLMIEFFYVWPALYAGYFFTRRSAVLVVAAIAVAYCGVQAAMGVDGSTLTIRATIAISVVAGVTAVAHALRRYVDALVQRLDLLARTDILTSLTNRRGFEEQLEEELARCRRTGEPLALLVGDLDRFKAVNDRFGHAAGDAVLTRTGRLLLDAVRGVDTPARIGGEEFAVLMPSTGGTSAVRAAERLRAVVAGVTDPDGRPIRITFGVASTETAGIAASDALLSAADQALYTAKQQGRDRTVAYEAERDSVFAGC